VARGKRVGAVVVAAETDGLHRARVLTLAGSIVVGSLLLAGVYLVMRLTVARALRPVADMAARAADWSIGDPNRRFGEPQKYLELTTLGHSLDALLDRVSGVLRHEQALTGELSHELRTPLARITAEAELLARSGTKGTREAIVGIQEGCARMERIIDTLLTSARADSAAPWRRDGVHIAVGVEPDDLHAGVDLNVCERIIAPIVDNAVRFARNGVSLTADATDGAVRLDISNDGPALPPELHEAIFTPGASVPQGRDRAGLGLALSRRLARAADGDVTVVSADPVTFRVLLPR
jgi:signal transduction histidine kinase